MVTANKHKIVKNKSKIYTFEGTKLVVTDVAQRKEYIELSVKLNETRSDLEASRIKINTVVEENDLLKERLNQIDETLNEIIKVGLIDYTIMNLMKEGE